MHEPTRLAPDAGALSNREQQMIDFITRGYTNDEIAQQTCLSINSIKSFIRAAYRKIGVDRRAHAIAWGFQHGYGCEESTG